jgi:hypothetical protein
MLFFFLPLMQNRIFSIDISSKSDYLLENENRTENSIILLFSIHFEKPSIKLMGHKECY